MTEDSELLQAYAETRSEAAFAELVRRRVGLVYSVALRQVGGDAHLAQDVTQRVFTDLARKAVSLAGRPVLSGWLYRSAQFAASDLVRSERRRRTREQENLLMNATVTNGETATAAADWEKLRPVLDEAMADLDDEDRDAVALRFLEEKPFAEIGRRLAISEEAARKRVTRALEKLHAGLAQRGITSTTAALALALGNQAAAAIPAGLAASVATVALAGASTWAGAAITFMSTKLFGMSAAAVAVTAIGMAGVQMNRARQREAELAAQTTQYQALQAKLAETERRAAEAEADTAKLLAAVQSRGAAPTTSQAANDQEPADLTYDQVYQRYNRAKVMAMAGDAAQALREFLWCFDVGMPRFRISTATRMGRLLDDIAKLGEHYAPAMTALRERRDQAEKRIWENPDDRAVYAAINRALVGSPGTELEFAL